MLIDQLLFTNPANKALRKTMGALSDRQLLIANNISNMDTPGYKATDIRFDRQLKDVIQSKNRLQMKATNDKHFGPSLKPLEALEALTPEVLEEEDVARSNGNNVNIDKEMTKLAETQITYNAVIQLSMKRGSTIRSAITELAQQ